MPEHFECTLVQKALYINTLPFLPFLTTKLLTRVHGRVTGREHG